MLRNKQPGAPRIVFSDEAEVTLGGVTVEVHYLGRGHTNGDSVVCFRDLRVIHAGDLVIDGMPYTPPVLPREIRVSKSRSGI